MFRFVAWSGAVAALVVTSACSSKVPKVNVFVDPDAGPTGAAATGASPGQADDPSQIASTNGTQPPGNGASVGAGTGNGANPAGVGINNPNGTPGIGVSDPGGNSSGVPSVTIAQTSCASEGTMRCTAEGSAGRQLCSAGTWQEHTACPDGQICLGEQALCQAQDEFCKGNAGGFACVGNALHQCDANARSINNIDCGHPDKCQLGKANGQCLMCLPGQDYQCDGANLMVCQEDGLGYKLREACSSAALCNVEAHACTAAACSADQVRCEGQRLQRCNSTQTGFEDLETCPTGTTCDAMGQQCDVCSRGETQCEGTSRQTCSDDGTAFVSDPCPSTTPFCSGQGSCVACAEDADCDAGPCTRATCDKIRGICQTSTTLGDSCAGGFCNLLSQCVPCVTDSNCGDGERCVLERCERKPACGDGFLDPFEACDDGNLLDRDTCNSGCTVSPPYAVGCGSNSSACLFDGNVACFFDNCSAPCSVAGDCPRYPSSDDGRAQSDQWKPVCDAGQCFLRCTQDQRCPTDMRCLDDGKGLRLCFSRNSPIQGGT